MGKDITIPTYDRRNGHATVPYAQFYPDDLLRNRRQRSLGARLLRLVYRVPPRVWLLLALLISCAFWFGIIRLVLAAGALIRWISGGDIS